MTTVLSLDGGGIRGLIPALVLQEIEARTDTPVAQLFDHIAGTSTGGILALGLTIPEDDGSGPAYSAGDLAQLYADRGSEIFDRSFWKGVSSVGGTLDEKYSPEGLNEALTDYFGHTPLGKAQADVLVSAYDIQNREPFFFKSWYEEHANVEMRRVARATSAAPTYFEPALASVEGSEHVLIDGGVFVNNPAMSAYAEAQRRTSEGEEIQVVSIGTGAMTRPISNDEAEEWGKAEWAIPLLDVVFDGVQDAVNYQLEYILGEGFHRFQVPLRVASDDMDNASPGNIENLRTEAERLIETHEEELDALCEVLSASQ